jgi:site-specific DNA-methyltransferase (adenine-specific)
MNNPTIIGKATLHNIDCMELLKSTPDKYYDLAIVDPPYGIDAANDARAGVKFNVAATVRKDYAKKDWDKNVPTIEYFNEIFRVSKNQIIWGVNYYPYDFLTGGHIFWDKDTAEDYTNGDGELAYCSLINSVKKYKYTWNGMIQGDMKNKEQRIHPTQKPIKLYEWLLTKFAKTGHKILDTHLGPGSHAIACNNLGFELTACELDKDYFDASVKRIQAANAQIRMFA